MYSSGDTPFIYWSFVMTSRSSREQQRDLFTKLKEYVQGTSDRVLRTPYRALDQAYQAALEIEAIEKEHFNGGKILTNDANYGGYVNSFIKADFERNLAIAKIRLAEFKASSFFTGALSPILLSKLTFVDEVVAKYAISERETYSSALVPVSRTQNAYIGSVNYPEYSSDIDDLNFGFATNKKSLLPRSIGKTINKIKEDLSPDTEQEIVRKFRGSRTKTLIAVRFVLTLIAVTVLTQQLSKNFLVSPIVERVIVDNQSEVFLNSEMKEEALKELQSFEETLKFESLTTTAPPISSEQKEKLVKRKAAELSEEYRQKSKNAISNVFSDLIAVGAFSLMLLMSRKEIIILKSCMDTIVYGLSDSAKAFIIILISDIFVGFHSPHGWEVLLEGLAGHLGIAANHSMISLFIATVPVVLDTMFKYWIFRSLSRMSPSTVATLKEMNE
jgi:CemA family